MRMIRDNGLTIVLSLATIACLFGMIVSGLSVYNQELVQHGRVALSAGQYAHSGHFLSALFENWESEFLQMSAYVVLTAFLYQRGSSESKDPDKKAAQDINPEAEMQRSGAPALLRSGRLLRTVYSYSLGLALFGLFVLSFALHLWQSAASNAAENTMHGSLPPSIGAHLMSAQFWFESFQNWQSEFLSTAVVVVFSIFLRFKGSPESKPVGASHAETGA